MDTIINHAFMQFIEQSPSCFHAVVNLVSIIEKQGYVKLKEKEKWELKKGGKYYVTRNDSSIIAFHIAKDLSGYHYQIASSHSDSPTFKVKEKAELSGKGGYLQLNVEGYGGMICSTWLDRPLSLAGRVLIKEDGKIQSRLFHVDKDLLIIPNMPIHMERTLNNGFNYNVQVDMLPLFSCGNLDKGSFDTMIAEVLNVEPTQVCGKDLFLYNREKPTIWGYKDEFISACKLDDLQCAYASFQALLKSEGKTGIQVAACFDNEEVGSLTKQGADSTLLYDVLTRINASLGYDEEDYHCAIAKSFMVSCDNAHALHPNHPEKYDVENYTLMNRGVVIKHNANQKYTSDAFSTSVFAMICEKAQVPVQHYANRSDVAGGSTLGNLSNAHVSLHCVDVGLAQLAMHSSYESAGSKDLAYLVEALTMYYSTQIIIDDSSSVEIK
ncbi:MAG: M18 family aminopeptidase [Erysipelotrichia bacterium]|nr:M18 family aminopeptidase [Erysipelotrichia bacterium]NCC54058.1 M18 family aminopeptidase [Erysipelotrichia bacterium]